MNTISFEEHVSEVVEKLAADNAAGVKDADPLYAEAWLYLERNRRHYVLSLVTLMEKEPAHKLEDELDEIIHLLRLSRNKTPDNTSNGRAS